jgi:hypothetical protein
MGRLVIVDAINTTASNTAGVTGPPTLAVTLTGRMFTRAVPAAAAGSVPAPGAVTGTTGATPPASGSSSGETSTSAQVN